MYLIIHTGEEITNHKFKIKISQQRDWFKNIVTSVGGVFVATILKIIFYNIYVSNNFFFIIFNFSQGQIVWTKRVLKFGLNLNRSEPIGN